MATGSLPDSFHLQNVPIESTLPSAFLRVTGETSQADLRWVANQLFITAEKPAAYANWFTAQGTRFDESLPVFTVDGSNSDAMLTAINERKYDPLTSFLCTMNSRYIKDFRTPARGKTRFQFQYTPAEGSGYSNPSFEIYCMKGSQNSPPEHVIVDRQAMQVGILFLNAVAESLHKVGLSPLTPLARIRFTDEGLRKLGASMMQSDASKDAQYLRGVRLANICTSGKPFQLANYTEYYSPSIAAASIVVNAVSAQEKRETTINIARKQLRTLANQAGTALKEDLIHKAMGYMNLGTEMDPEEIFDRFLHGTVKNYTPPQQRSKTFSARAKTAQTGGR